MKKIFLMTAALCSYVYINAQTIIAAEFFIDTDPGVGNGTAITPAPSGINPTFAATVPTTSLANGFHFVAIRTKDSDGKWGMFENRGFYITTATNNVGNITAAEFFVDTDPGTGNGTPITIAAGPNPGFIATVPTTSLANGFHFVAIRTKDADSKWSMFENRGFYITTATNNVGNITAAEFFVDTDPGTGNGTPITIAAGPNPTFVATVPTTSLANGFHFVAIRTKDADGKWGMFENRGFYISTATNNVGNISASEFFVDTDPGIGNGTPISIGAGPNPVFVANVPTTSLANGFHFIAIRTKDTDGKWGMFENRGFYISTATNNEGNMIAAEYFIDTDPGIGNGTPFTIPAGASFDQNFVLNIPPGTSNGTHFIAIRVMNDKWGLLDFDTITVSGSIPLHLLDFDGYKKLSIVKLNWKTENEINTSHFEIERSKNGVSFSSIGRVNSNNRSGPNEYAFDDVQPFTGLNFYRLKQVDKDGRFEYSPIIKILFESYGKPLNVYPNPATNFVQFDFDGKQKTILVTVFDATGKQVLNQSLANQAPLKINISALAKGNYFVQLSDGETIAKGSFIKQ